MAGRLLAIVAAVFVGCAGFGGAASTGAAARAASAPIGVVAGLRFAYQVAVHPERARRLPSLPVAQVPLPAMEPPDAPSVAPLVPPQIATVAPTPLLRSWRRGPARAATSPSVGGTLIGLSSGAVNPADVQIAAGPSDVVEMTNAGVDVWTTQGRIETSESLGAYFTDTGTDRRSDQMSDPRVLYDTQSQHWFAIVLDVTRQTTVMAISPTPIPGSGSFIYTFPSSGCPDQPRLGISDTLVAFGDDLFSDCGQFTYLIGGEVTILNKANLIAGTTADEDVYGPSFLYGHITPAVSLSSTPNLWFAATSFLYDTVELFAADKVHADALGLRELGLGALSAAPDALQSDPALINTGDNRVQNAVWENNHLWLAVSDGCLVQGEDGVHACARYVGIDTTDNENPFVTMNVDMALDQGQDIFYPAIMPSSDGTLYSVFGYSSASETPGIGITTQPQDFSGWSALKVGAGANESGRWGDYFGIALDPTDPTHIWVAGAYGTGGDTWGTTVGVLGPAPFSITPPAARPAPTPQAPKQKPKLRVKRKEKPKAHKGHSH